jgi:flavodoxin
MKTLIAWFSWGGTCRALAEQLGNALPAETFQIARSEDYPSDYNECVKQSVSEKQANARPDLKSEVPDASGFNRIILIYPNWCGTCPMPVFSFLDQFQTAGRMIFPICLNGGSGLASSVADIKAAAPQAAVREGLSLSGSLPVQAHLARALADLN